MRPRRAIATKAPAPERPDEGYRSLSVAEVLSDLGSLNRDQLLLVKSLEEAGDQRSVILDRIDDLLVVQEAADHMRGSPVGTTPPNLPPPAPVKAVSPELLNQMDGLLAKDAARKSWVPGAPPAPSGPDQLTAPPIPATRPTWTTRTPRTPRTTRTTRKSLGKVAPPTPNGHIVPTDGRRSRSGRGAKYLVVVLILALVGGGGAVFWRHSHPNTGTSATSATSAPRGSLAALLIPAPAGYSQQPDTVGGTGPTDLAQAVRGDGAADAQTALTKAGFVQGYRRLWSTIDHQHQVVVTLYRFRTAPGATAYAQRTVAAARASAKPAVADFPVAGIPGAVGFSGGAGRVHSAETVFTRGGNFVSIVARGPSAIGVVAVARQVATGQYALLPAS
ncbi:MAG: hypothetical protein M3083_14735 [Actinomycetota bacterium]|nr:hypothetical protein [Actinomycetota bacterium]